MDDRTFEILMVDDEQDVLDALFLTLKRAKDFKCEITTANDGNKALEIMETKEFDLVISDFKMPEMNGIELLSKVRVKHPQTIRFLVTGYSDVNVAKEAINKAQVHNYIEKPWDNEALRATVLEALKLKVGKENEKVTKTNNVDEALKLISKAQADNTSNRGEGIKKNIMLLEFPNTSDFNTFSNQIKNWKNVVVEDVQIIGGKYVVKVSFYPRSYSVIR
jgi:YesN/AraC family two-component response regulator